VDILMGGRITRLTHQKEPILDLATMVRLQHRTATQALAIAVIGMAFTAETREQTTQKCKRGFTYQRQPYCSSSSSKEYEHDYCHQGHIRPRR
jgi:hypothetical protein